MFQGNSVDYAIKALSLTYYSPTQNTKKHIFIKYLLGVCNLLLVSLVALDLIHTGFTKHVTEFLEHCEWFALIMEVSYEKKVHSLDLIINFKVLIDQVLNLIWFRDVFKNLLIKRKQFRNAYYKLPTYLNGFLLILFLYAFLCAISVLYVIVFSMYTQKFAVPMWYPKEYPSVYKILLYCQWIWVAFLGTFEYAGICFFNALCQEVALQFKLLNSMTEQVLKKCINKNRIELKEIIRYHRFLIR